MTGAGPRQGPPNALLAVIVLSEHLPLLGLLGPGLMFASLVTIAANTRATATGHPGNRPTEPRTVP